MTPFREIVELAFIVITDDTFSDSLESYQEFIDNGVEMVRYSLPFFQFPRFNINAIEEIDGDVCFSDNLSQEERLIIAQMVAVRWLERQILSTELTRQEVYASSDFKKTSQASHLSRLIALKKEVLKENARMQGWYNRRTIGDGGAVSSFSGLAGGKTNA
ncbi:MAG: hypothetical protein ACRCZZ_06085 [Phocaeicola sp.]